MDFSVDAAGGVRGAGRQPGLFKAGADRVDVRGRLVAGGGAMRVSWKEAKVDAMGATAFAFCHLAPRDGDLAGVLLSRSPNADFDSGEMAADAAAPNVGAVFALRPKGDGPNSLWAQLRADPAAADLVAALAAHVPDDLGAPRDGHARPKRPAPRLDDSG